MVGIHGFWLFVLAGVLLNLTPGQDTLFIIGRSLTGGRRAGLAAAAGISAGSVVHTVAAAFGLSAVLRTSATAFAVVKVAGALYLIYLGAKLLLARTPRGPGPASDVRATAAAGAGPSLPATGLGGASRGAFLQGIFTNVLNPKVALFFLAFLPQFIDPASTTKTLAFLALGATFITTGLLWSLVLATGAARLQGFFARNPDARVLIDRTVGAVFLVVGLRLAWSR